MIKLPFHVKNEIMIPITMGLIASGITFVVSKNKTSLNKSILISLGVGVLVGVGEAYYGWVVNGSPKK